MMSQAQKKASVTGVDTHNTSLMRFLTLASRELSTSLDYSVTLSKISELVVPTFADYFAIELIKDSGELQTLYLSHVNPKKIEIGRELLEKYRAGKEDSAVWSVIRSGTSKLFSELPEQLIYESAKDKHHIEILKEIGFISIMIVPIIVFKKVRGVITFVSTKESNRHYTQQDVVIAEDLAYRAGLALENARLYKEAKEEIKHRKKIEEQLRSSRDQLNVILQNVADGISVQDITGKLVFINDAGAQLLGFSTAQEFMDSTEKLSPEMFRKKYLDRFEMRDELDKQIPYNELPAYKVLQGAEQAEKVINYYDTKTRLSHWSIVKSRPIYDDEGKVQLAVNIFSDITERKLVEKQKDEFISIASHELKTPLTGIKGFTQLLEKYFKEKQDKKAMDYLNYMNGQVGRLTNLIENFLDISKIQSGKLVFQEAIFKFDELVDELIKEVQLSTDHKIINESNTDVYVFGDRFRVGQVLTNLLTNAIKYSPQGEKVIVKTKHDKDIITVAVKDFGIGIPPDKQYKIFERFYRVPGKATESYPGMGLGLFISQEIIKRHNGKMWVKSKEGKGSTFYFTLPITLHSQFGKQ